MSVDDISFVIIDLDLSRLSTLVTKAPRCLAYATRRQVYWRFDTDEIMFAITMIRSYSHRHTQTEIHLLFL